METFDAIWLGVCAVVGFLIMLFWSQDEKITFGPSIMLWLFLTMVMTLFSWGVIHGIQMLADKPPQAEQTDSAQLF